jgi:NitT/TauT family transport system permease protein
MTTTVRDGREQPSPPGEADTGVALPHRIRRAGGAFYRQVGLPILGIVTTIGIWWWATWYFQIRTFWFPSPGDVANSLQNNAEHLLDQSRVTVYETLAGFGIGAGAGLLAAALLAVSPALERATLPLFIALNAIPKVALAPLFLIWFGLDHAPKIAMAASICFFPIMIAAMAGLNSTPADLDELARSLSASRRRAFFKIRVPWAMPQVFVGLKLGMTLAVIGAVVGQIARPSGGLGTVILLAQQHANTPQIFAAILLLTIISVALFYAVVLAERLLLPWTRATATGRP